MCYHKIMNCSSITPIVGNLQTIGINRGTSLRLKAQRIDYQNNPILVKATSAFFVVKKCWKNQDALITKTLDDMTFDENGYYHFAIKPEDTENLPYGKYVWDFTANQTDDYRAKPSHGYLIVGNSACWIVNQDESGD